MSQSSPLTKAIRRRVTEAVEAAVLSERERLRAQIDGLQAKLRAVEVLAEQLEADAKLEPYGGELWSTTATAIRVALDTSEREETSEWGPDLIKMTPAERTQWANENLGVMKPELWPDDICRECGEGYPCEHGGL